jgi:putative NADPH-quinone reductase
MHDTVVISGHPNPEQSYANKTILKYLETRKGLHVNHLIELYPDYQVNAEKEINALIRAKNVVLQFPFHWYGVPAILKIWIDSITTPMVYGQFKGALKNKTLVISTTTGGPAESYSSTGYNKYTMKEFLLPIIKLGDSLGMNVLEPVISHSASTKDAGLEERLRQHANSILAIINMENEGILERQI